MPYIGNIVQDFSVNNAMLNTDSVTSIKIDDGTIVNADINDSAAIAGSKISPSFTSDLTITDVSPAINFTDSNNDSDFKIIVNDGKIKIQDTTNSNAVRFSINSSGNVGIGTASPTHMLDVSGSNPILSLNDTDTTNDRFRLTYNGGSTQLQVDPNNVRSGSHLLVAVDGTERMRIDSSGLVGIGTGDPGGYNSNANHLVINKASGNVGLTISSASNAIGSIAFADGDDNDVGMIRYAHSENNMLFTTNASERMRINSSGKVGIGTTSPASFLEIASHNNAETDKFDASNYHLHLRNTENDNGEAIGISFAITSDETAVGAAILHERDAGGSQGSLQFLTNGNGSSITERMRINSAGKIGINYSGNPPSEDVMVCTAGQASPAGLSLSHLSGGNRYGARLSTISGTNSGVIFSTLFNSGYEERMRIDSSGNVGIGTSSPININSYAGLTLGDSNGGIISFLDSGVERGRTGLVGELVYVVQCGPGSSSITFDRLTHDGSNNVNGATELGRFNPNGHFLVGTTSDTTGGTAATEGVAIRKEGHVVSRGTSSSGAKFTAKTTDTGTSQAFRVMLAQTEIGSIGMGAGGTSFNTSSDYRRKENIVDLTNAITRLKTLLPKRFNFKDEPSVTRDGFLAHEVTAVPEAVTGTKDAVEPEDNEDSGVKKGDPIYQQLDQSKLVPLLVAALQEAIGRIEALEAK